MEPQQFTGTSNRPFLYTYTRFDVRPRRCLSTTSGQSIRCLKNKEAERSLRFKKKKGQFYNVTLPCSI